MLLELQRELELSFKDAFEVTARSQRAAQKSRWKRFKNCLKINRDIPRSKAAAGRAGSMGSGGGAGGEDSSSNSQNTPGITSPQSSVGTPITVLRNLPCHAGMLATMGNNRRGIDGLYNRTMSFPIASGGIRIPHTTTEQRTSPGGCRCEVLNSKMNFDEVYHPVNQTASVDAETPTRFFSQTPMTDVTELSLSRQVSDLSPVVAVLSARKTMNRTNGIWSDTAFKLHGSGDDTRGMLDNTDSNIKGPVEGPKKGPMDGFIVGQMEDSGSQSTNPRDHFNDTHDQSGAGLGSSNQSEARLGSSDHLKAGLGSSDELMSAGIAIHINKPGRATGVDDSVQHSLVGESKVSKNAVVPELVQSMNERQPDNEKDKLEIILCSVKKSEVLQPYPLIKDYDKDIVTKTTARRVSDEANPHTDGSLSIMGVTSSSEPVVKSPNGDYCKLSCKAENLTGNGQTDAVERTPSCTSSVTLGCTKHLTNNSTSPTSRERFSTDKLNFKTTAARHSTGELQLAVHGRDGECLVQSQAGTCWRSSLPGQRAEGSPNQNVHPSASRNVVPTDQRNQNPVIPLLRSSNQAPQSGNKRGDVRSGETICGVSLGGKEMDKAEIRYAGRGGDVTVAGGGGNNGRAVELFGTSDSLQRGNNGLRDVTVVMSTSASGLPTPTGSTRRVQRAQAKRQERRQDKKAAKTLSAILLAFLVTWTPYNVFTLINAFRPATISDDLYNFGKSAN